MRFNTYGTYAPPTPTIVGVTQFLASPDVGLQWDTFTGPSGESGIITLGESLGNRIKLLQVVCSWSGLELAGRLEISVSEKPLFVVYQTTLADTLTLPLNDSLPITESYGLRCDNNSVGGEYSVTAYYHKENQ